MEEGGDGERRQRRKEVTEDRGDGALELLLQEAMEEGGERGGEAEEMEMKKGGDGRGGEEGGAPAPPRNRALQLSDVERGVTTTEEGALQLDDKGRVLSSSVEERGRSISSSAKEPILLRKPQHRRGRGMFQLGDGGEGAPARRQRRGALQLDDKGGGTLAQRRRRGHFSSMMDEGPLQLGDRGGAAPT